MIFKCHIKHSIRGCRLLEHKLAKEVKDDHKERDEYLVGGGNTRRFR